MKTKFIMWFVLTFAFVRVSAAQPGWTQLPNTTLTSVCPTGTMGDCTGAIETWSGGVFDSTRNRMIIWGGGHGNYNGNEVYAVYPPGATLPGSPAVCSAASAPAICRIKDHSPSLRSTADTSGPVAGCWTTETNGEPNNRHTYSGLTYIANLDKMFANGGSLTCGNGSHAGDTWLLNLPTLTWASQDPVTNGGGSLIPRDICSGCSSVGQGPESLAVYDPVRQLVFLSSALYASTAGANVWSYNPSTNTYTTLTTSFPVAFNAHWVLDPKRHKIFGFGNNTTLQLGNASTQMGTPQINALDVSSGGSYTIQDLSNTAGTCDGLSGSVSPGLVYWQTLDRIVGWPNFGNTVYIYNPDTNRCSTLTYSGGPPDSKDASGTVQTTGTYGRMQYFPSLDAAIICNDGDNNCYELELPNNSITITNTGSSTTNYPVQIGRAFAKGEIPNGSLPQATVDGTSVSTQVDVRARWDDNSLKHAVISFLIPTFNVNQVSTVSFAAGTTVGNTPLTQAQMENAVYNFDAHISLTKSGVTKGADATYSALTMLTNSTSIPDCNTVNWSTQTGVSACYWNQGPIATTVILGNHSQSTTCGGNAASTYDFGFDSFCAFRPEFEATFWATTHQVRIRFIGEIANTEQLENVPVDNMALTVGHSPSTTVYTRATALTMRAATRWTKVYWLNGTPPEAAYNHNLAYLASTKALANYDTGKTVSSSDLAAQYSIWNSAGKDLYSVGEIDQPENGGGAHKYIGTMPGWNIRWLMSGDVRAQEEVIGTDGTVSTVAGGPSAVTVGNTELASTFEVHYREGNCSKLLYGSTNGCGRVLSITSRPTLYICCGYNNGATADKIVPVGATSAVWSADVAHLPQFFYSAYLVTGDHFYYDEDSFFQAWTTAYVGADTSTFRSRGPTGTEGGLPDWGNQILQLRGQGWGMLHREELAWITPDAAPEKAMWTAFVNNNIDLWEGQRIVTTGHGHTTGALACASGGGSTCTAMWNWGYNTAFPASGSQFWSAWDGTDTVNLGVPALHFWSNGKSGLCYNSVNSNDGFGIIEPTSVLECLEPWMGDYLDYALGRGAELGYPTNSLVTWAAPHLIGPLTDPTYNPYLAGAYSTPLINTSGAWYSTWAQVLGAYLTSGCGVANPNGGSYTGNCQTETTWTASRTGTNDQYNPDADVQPQIAAMAMLAGEANGGAAWNWVATHLEGLTSLNSDYKWFILPRGSLGASVSNCQITTTTLPNGKINLSYSQTLAESGCAAGGTWTLASGSLGQLALNVSTGAITGTPTSATTLSGLSFTYTSGTDVATSGTMSITIDGATAVTDDFNRSSLGSNWTVDAGSIGIGTSGYANQTAGSGYSLAHWSANIFAADQYAQVTAYVSGSGSGSIGPAVRQTGTGAYGCLATNSTGPVSLIRLDSGALGATLGTYSYTVATGDVIKLDVAGSSLTCKVNGTSRITATDTTYSSGSAGVASFGRSYLLADAWAGGDASAPPVITATLLPTATVGSSYTQAITAAGGTTPYTWDISAGSLSACNTGGGTLALGSGGSFTGAPSAAGYCNFTARVTDSASQTATQAFSLIVNPSAAATFSNPAEDACTHTGCRVQVTTSASSTDDRVEFSTSSILPFGWNTETKHNYGNLQYTTDHGQWIGALKPSSVYYYRYCSSAGGVEGCSAIRTLTTTAAPADRTVVAAPIATAANANPVTYAQTINVTDCTTLLAAVTTAKTRADNGNVAIVLPTGFSCNLGNAALGTFEGRACTGQAGGCGYIDVIWSARKDYMSNTVSPPLGVRADPNLWDLSGMPFLTSSYFATTFQFGLTAEHVRLIGVKLEATGTAGTLPNSPSYGVVSVGSGPVTAHHLVMDQVVIDQPLSGLSSQLSRVTGSDVAITNSYFRTYAYPGSYAYGGAYAQGILGDGSTRMNFYNNYIAATTMCFFVQGGNGFNHATDITYRRNYCTWRPADNNQDQDSRQQWELKDGERVLADGNLFVNQWHGGIVGSLNPTIAMSTRSETGRNSQNTIADVQFTNNTLKNIPGGFFITGDETGSVNYSAKGGHRYKITNNLITALDGYVQTQNGGYGNNSSSGGFLLELGQGLEDLNFSHNTVCCSHRGVWPSIIVGYGNRISGLRMQHNLFDYSKDTHVIANAGGLDTTSGGGTSAPAVNTSSFTTVFQSFVSQIQSDGSNPVADADPASVFSDNIILAGVTDSSVLANWADSTKNMTDTGQWGSLGTMMTACDGGVSPCTATGRINHLHLDSTFRWTGASPTHTGTDGLPLGADLDALDLAQGLVPDSLVSTAAGNLYYTVRDSAMQCYVDTGSSAGVYSTRAADTPGATARTFPLGGATSYRLSCAGGIKSDGTPAVFAGTATVPGPGIGVQVRGTSVRGSVK